MTEVNDLFVRASRLKLRIPTAQGSITVEDLWDLEIISNRPQRVTLDSLAVELNRLIKANSEEPTSFVNASGTNSVLTFTKLQFDVVKYVLDVRLAEQTEKEEANKKALQKRRLQEALANREQRDIESMTAEQIREELEKM